MTTFITFCKTNPVRAMAILQSLIVLIVSFGARLTPPQIAAITGFATLIFGLGGELVRSQVIPTATLPDHVAAAVNATVDAGIPKRAVIVPPSTPVVPTVVQQPSEPITIKES